MLHCFLLLISKCWHVCKAAECLGCFTSCRPIKLQSFHSISKWHLAHVILHIRCEVSKETEACIITTVSSVWHSTLTFGIMQYLAFRGFLNENFKIHNRKGSYQKLQACRNFQTKSTSYTNGDLLTSQTLTATWYLSNYMPVFFPFYSLMSSPNSTSPAPGCFS